MTISYPLTFPTTLGPSAITIRSVNATAITRSPFTFHEQAISHTGQRWEAEVQLPPMDRADAEVWVAWLVSLKGHAGTFTMGDPTAATARGSAGGTPLVNGASQTGATLALDGATASQTGWLKAGDYIQLGSGSTAALHKVLTDADSDAGGNVTLDIWPDLRSSPADNAAVTVADTVGLWRLTNRESSWDVNETAHFGAAFACGEAIS